MNADHGVISSVDHGHEDVYNFCTDVLKFVSLLSRQSLSKVVVDGEVGHHTSQQFPTSGHSFEKMEQKNLESFNSRNQFKALTLITPIQDFMAKNSKSSLHCIKGLMNAFPNYIFISHMRLKKSKSAWPVVILA